MDKWGCSIWLMIIWLLASCHQENVVGGHAMGEPSVTKRLGGKNPRRTRPRENNGDNKKQGETDKKVKAGG